MNTYHAWKLRLAYCAIVVASTASCNGGANLGADLTIVVSPSKASLIPGNNSNCTDWAAYGRAIQASPQVPPTLATSVNAYSVAYSNFGVAWGSPDLLVISVIRITVSNPNLSSPYKLELTSGDVEAILALSAGSPFNGSFFSNVGSPRTVTTQDANRIISITNKPLFPSCSFSFGGISVSPTARQFTGRAKIEIIGFAINASGQQRPVKQSTFVDFDYFP